MYGGLTEDLARSLLNEHDLYVSPMVRLELQYLLEIESVSVQADRIIMDLGDRLGLRICEKDFNRVIGYALGLNWTRDPFDCFDLQARRTQYQ